jgi:hypothetical protein
MQELHVLIMPDLSFHWHVNPGPSSGALSPEFDGTVAFDKANRGNPISTDTAVDVGATEHSLLSQQAQFVRGLRERG